MKQTSLQGNYRQIPGWVTVMPDMGPGTYIVEKCNEDGTTSDFSSKPEIVIDPHKSLVQSIGDKSMPRKKGGSMGQQVSEVNSVVMSEPVTDESSLFNKVSLERAKKPISPAPSKQKIKVVMEVSGSPFRTIAYLDDFVEVTGANGDVMHLVLVMSSEESDNKVQIITGSYEMAVAVEKENSLYLTSLESAVSFVYQNKEFYVLPVLTKGKLNEEKDD